MIKKITYFGVLSFLLSVAPLFASFVVNVENGSDQVIQCSITDMNHKTSDPAQRACIYSVSDFFVQNSVLTLVSNCAGTFYNDTQRNVWLNCFYQDGSDALEVENITASGTTQINAGGNIKKRKIKAK